ncbi:MAG: hypothetical protein JO309_01545 [Pseudonocardiales bacterium]|nr:hypothetical protein [Hyphomicrobiales bacterium]MBV8825505.1 hypothetical protein [Hyphomicrobiales bacterium]MBV9429431.1 hypothetical protein [Bradyrhizobiaceae bacterium]MBV9728099.1 hypothetical protein [Pseudonocardiales bacterium]
MLAQDSWIELLNGQPIATPAYVFSAGEITRQMRALGAALGTPLVFSVSACPNADLLMRLAEDVRFGLRCSSRAEMSLVSGWQSEFSYVNLPSIDVQTMRALLGGKFRLIVDAPHQVELLAKLRGKREVMPLTLGVNVGVVNQSIEGAALPLDHLGMDWDDLRQALALTKAHDIPVDGLQTFGGRHSFGRHAMSIVRAIQDLVPRVEAHLGRPLRTVNLGGGLEENWQAMGHDFAAYRREVRKFPEHLQVMHDVGRSVMSSAGCFVTSVVARKSIQGRSYAICDGGMIQAFLLSRAAGEHCLASQPLVRSGDGPIRAAHANGGGETTIIVGSSSNRADILGSATDELLPGDILYFPGAGAYCRTYTPGEYLGHGGAVSYVL